MGAGIPWETMNQVVEVAVGLPVSKTFHYAVPEKMRDSLQIGMRVLVPFQGRKVTGFILDLLDRSPKEIENKLRDIEDVLDDAPLIGADMLRFFRWISDYYLYPLGEVIKTGLPPGLHLKSEPNLSLTPEGIAWLGKGNLDPFVQGILREVERCKTVGLKKILGLLPGQASRAQIFSLKRRGFLAIEDRVEPQRVRPKMEKTVRLRIEEGAGPSTEKQERIVSWLKAKGDVSVSALNKVFPSSWSSIRSLERKGFVSTSLREVSRDGALRSDLDPYPRPELTPAQDTALAEIFKGLRSNRFASFLIHGVTGSGKTEIYLRAVEETLARGGEAIVLVPEIALTPQLLSRFSDRFRQPFALLHSGLAPGERYDQWRKIWRGNVKLVLGARSAVFAPFKNLRMIIVDEEHDPSYKQEEKLKYHARDLAVVRAKQADATLLLGSATPSLESFYNAEQGRFQLLRLAERIGRRALPRVEVVNMRGEEGVLSGPLKSALAGSIREKKQSLISLNRRWFSSCIICPDCGLTFKCPNCSITLTFHLQDRSLRCHYCDYLAPAPGDCPGCGGHRLRGTGVGTERLEEEIRTLFPGTRVERMDRDTTSRKHGHGTILKRLQSGSIDVLVGTQMIVKGHDFPNVTFVGVLSADASLHFPDFRSSERTFQLLTQAAGRAGRGGSGEVVVQTLAPDHYSIVRAKDHDFVGFYQEEIQFRSALEYPPFSRLINFRVTGNSERRTEQVAREMGRIAESIWKTRYSKTLVILGPARAPLSKMRGRYRWQMLAKGKSARSLHGFARELDSEMKARLKAVGARLDIDVDPVFIL
jgi:primosomal protein N' (replication factor Y) (superfamily II helicase)